MWPSNVLSHVGFKKEEKKSWKQLELYSYSLSTVLCPFSNTIPSLQLKEVGAEASTTLTRNIYQEFEKITDKKCFMSVTSYLKFSHFLLDLSHSLFVSSSKPWFYFCCRQVSLLSDYRKAWCVWYFPSLLSVEVVLTTSYLFPYVFRNNFSAGQHWFYLSSGKTVTENLLLVIFCKFCFVH